MDYWKLLQRKAATLIALSRREQVLFLLALLLFPLVFISLHLRGLRFTQRILGDLPQGFLGNAAGPEPERVWLTMRMVRLAGRYSHLWSNCLKKSLVLWALLRAQGIQSHLRIGVQRDAGKFKAHAWVEYGDVVLNDQSDVALVFAPFQHSFEVSG